MAKLKRIGMSSNLLAIGSSALAASQSALQTAGHNIANVNTTGYSRQSLVLSSRSGDSPGASLIGQGVDVSTVERHYDEFQFKQLAIAQSVSSADTIRFEYMEQLEQLFPTGSSGLGASVNQLLNAFSDLAQSPSDMAARTVVLAQADQLASRIRSVSQQVDEIDQSVELRLKSSVASINSLCSQIAQLNQQIVNASAAKFSHNDLLDQRDQLVQSLNQQVQVSSLNNADHSITLLLSVGQPLVQGSQSNSLVLQSDATPTNQPKLLLRQTGQDLPLEDSTLGGGELAGLLKFQNKDLQVSRDQLWKLTLSVGEGLNQQHRLGLDLRGVAGIDLFNVIALQSDLNNQGNAGLSVSLGADPTGLVRSDYLVTINTVVPGPMGGASGSVNITRLSDGTQHNAIAFSYGLGSGTDVTAALDGLDFEFSGNAPVVGDRYGVSQSKAAQNITAALSDPAQLAVANTVLASVGALNTGSLRLESIKATQPDSALLDSITLEFNGAGGYTARNALLAVVGTGAYDPGQPLVLNGWSLTLQGQPAVGDTVRVQANDASIERDPPASALMGPLLLDAGNAKAMLDYRDAPADLFEGSSISEIYAAMLADLGVRVLASKTAADVSRSLFSVAQQARAERSGVNLDEEAATLIQYQQSYQAAGKMLQVSQTIFDALLQAVH